MKNKKVIIMSSGSEYEATIMSTRDYFRLFPFVECPPVVYRENEEGWKPALLFNEILMDKERLEKIRHHESSLKARLIREAWRIAGFWADLSKDVSDTHTLQCPICGESSGTEVCSDTVLKNFPLHCNNCKAKVIINYDFTPTGR